MDIYGLMAKWFHGEMQKIHVLNHGLHYASCVFEGERVYNSKIFKLTEHTERLHKSADILGFKIPYSVEELDSASKEVVRVNNVENGYVRPFAWRVVRKWLSHHKPVKLMWQ